MKHESRRSLLRRFGPLALVVIGVSAIFLQMGMANAATTPIGNQDASCQSTGGFKDYWFTVNGNRSKTLTGHTTQSDNVSLHFELRAACDNLYVGLSSFTSNGPAVSNGHLNPDQKVWQTDADKFNYKGGAEHVLKVTLPPCYFQVDAYTGGKFKVGDYTGAGGPGFISGDYGGNSSSKCYPTTTTVPPTTQPNQTTTTVPGTTTTTQPITTTSTTQPDITTTTSTTQPDTTTTSTSTTQPGVTTTSTTQPATTSTTKPTTTTTHPCGCGPTTTTTTHPCGCGPTTTTTQPANTPSTANINQVCKAGGSGWTVVYTNKSNSTQTFVLTSASKTIDTVSVAGHKLITKTYTFNDNGVAQGASIDLTVKIGDKTVGSGSVKNDCVGDVVKVDSTCSATGPSAVFTFTNNGKIDEKFDITDSSGKALSWSSLTVKAGATVTKTQVIADNAQTDFKVHGQNTGIDPTESVTAQCAQVQGETITPPTTTPSPTTTSTVPASVLGESITRPLAFTGFNAIPLLIGGVILLVFGGALLLSARRSGTGSGAGASAGPAQ